MMKPQTFASFDEYAVSLGHSNLRLTALGRQRKPWAMCACMLDDVRVRWARDGGPILAEAAIDAEGIGLMACIDAAGKVSGNSVMFGSRSVMAIPGHTEIQSVSLDAVTWMSTFIPASRLHAQDGDCDARRIPCGVIEPATADGRKFREMLGCVVKAAMAGAFESNPFGQYEASEQLVTAARSLLWPSPSPDDCLHHPGRHRISRSEIIRRVDDLLDSRPGMPLALDDLINATGVSGRTLHNAFQEQFGISPKQFLRVRILNAARRELCRADPECTRVTDIAAKLGIWEWGRFSRDYRALFDELPSQTLRRMV